ncbi:MAG: DUF2946 family protein [Methylocystis sp.]
MRQDRRKIRRFVRPVLAVAVACLLFQQALNLVFPQAHHGGDFFSSPVAMSYELCADQNGGGGKTQHVQHMHCTACFLTDRHDDLGAKILLSAVILVLAPLSDDPPIWIERQNLAPPATQRPSNRLSRAPPSLLS